MTNWQLAILCLTILFCTSVISLSLLKLAEGITFGIIKHAILSNFSRFGNWPETDFVILNDIGYFMREGALWKCQTKDAKLLKSTAVPVDLFAGDNIEDALAAVDVFAIDFEEMEKGD